MQFFSKYFPKAKFLSSLDSFEALEARWIHLSSHLDWDPLFWQSSRLGSAADRLTVAHLLQKPLRCSLLSLGVCDAGNGFDGITPFWMGLAEAFLTNGAQSLLVSRWKMDHLSSRIYLDFYRLAREGLSMDQALSNARRSFRETVLTRGHSRHSGDHPFFWAGISYVGWPGTSLCPDSGIYQLDASWTLLAVLWILLNSFRNEI
jgi:CHAT domain-containing protein